MGIDPVHIGIVICLNLVLGLVTPRWGPCCSRSAAWEISHRPARQAVWMPFFVSLIVLAIVTYVPWLSTYLPKTLMDINVTDGLASRTRPSDGNIPTAPGIWVLPRPGADGFRKDHAMANQQNPAARCAPLK